MTDLRTALCGSRLKNPTVLPAGILGVTAASLARAARSGAGAVTTKSIGPERREGHRNPVVIEVSGGLLNAVGLSCPRLDESLDELKEAVKQSSSPVIASFYGRTVEEFAVVAERISEARPALIEANISCPNIEEELGKPFATDLRLAGKVTCAVKDATKIPLIVKLTPNVSDVKAIAACVEEAGADCICAINTLGPGMVIDIDSCRLVLTNKTGGLSGPAVRPIAVRCIYEIYEAVDVPLVGVGGVSSGRDVAEMLMAGASAVGIGTAVWKEGLGVFARACDELSRFMERNDYSKVRDLVGLAHDSSK